MGHFCAHISKVITSTQLWLAKALPLNCPQLAFVNIIFFFFFWTGQGTDLNLMQSTELKLCLLQSPASSQPTLVDFKIDAGLRSPHIQCLAYLEIPCDKQYQLYMAVQ